MPTGDMLQYMFILIAVAVCVLLTLGAAQRAAMKELRRVLAEEKDIPKYQQMLKSRPLRIVMRKSTLVLLALDGYTLQGNDDMVLQAAAMLDGMKLRPGEKLMYYQKAFSYFLSAGLFEDARRVLALMEALLANEKDPKLQEVLRDAKLLGGIYLDRDTGLIAQLLRQEAEQSGHQQGVTRYRLAKLYHFDGQADKAAAYLKKAQGNLRETGWDALLQAALQDPAVLEVQ